MAVVPGFSSGGSSVRSILRCTGPQTIFGASGSVPIRTSVGGVTGCQIVGFSCSVSSSETTVSSPTAIGGILGASSVGSFTVALP